MRFAKSVVRSCLSFDAKCRLTKRRQHRWSFPLPLPARRCLWFRGALSAGQRLLEKGRQNCRRFRRHSLSDGREMLFGQGAVIGRVAGYRSGRRSPPALGEWCFAGLPELLQHLVQCLVGPGRRVLQFRHQRMKQGDLVTGDAEQVDINCPIDLLAHRRAARTRQLPQVGKPGGAEANAEGAPVETRLRATTAATCPLWRRSTRLVSCDSALSHAAPEMTSKRNGVDTILLSWEIRIKRVHDRRSVCPGSPAIAERGHPRARRPRDHAWDCPADVGT